MRRRSFSVLFYRCDDGWSAYFPAYPEVVVWYPTLAQTRRAAREALALFIDALQEAGEPPRQEAGTPRLGSVLV